MPDNGLASWFPHPIPEGIPTQEQAIFFDQIRQSFSRLGFGVTFMRLFSAPQGRLGSDRLTYRYGLFIMLDVQMGVGTYEFPSRFNPYVVSGLGDTPIGALDYCLDYIKQARAHAASPDQSQTSPTT